MKQDVAKLPQWVQKRIKTLEQAVVHSQAEIEELKQELSGDLLSPVVLDPYRDKRPLPADKDIRFHLKDEHYVDVTIDNGLVRVRGNRCIMIHPESGNSVWVGVNVI